MNFAKFILADEESQNKVIDSADFVAQLKGAEGSRRLHQFSDFYIEKCYDAGGVLTAVHAFETDSPKLEPYLAQIAV